MQIINRLKPQSRNKWSIAKKGVLVIKMWKLKKGMCWINSKFNLIGVTSRSATCFGCMTILALRQKKKKRQRTCPGPFDMMKLNIYSYQPSWKRCILFAFQFCSVSKVCKEFVWDLHEGTEADTGAVRNRDRGRQGMKAEDGRRLIRRQSGRSSSAFSFCSVIKKWINEKETHECHNS